MSQSRENGKIYGTLELHDFTDHTYYPVRPSYAGDIKYSVQSNDHNGWLLCNGRSLDSVSHAKLYNVIGTSFGSDEEGSFKIPDCRGRVLGMIGSGSGLTSRSLGDVLGEEKHTMTINELARHTHTINDPGHSHTYTGTPNDQGVNTLTTQNDAADNYRTSQNTGVSSTGITNNTTGNSLPFNVMQPTVFIGNVFIFSYITV